MHKDVKVRASLLISKHKILGHRVMHACIKFACSTLKFKNVSDRHGTSYLEECIRLESTKEDRTI